MDLSHGCYYQQSAPYERQRSENRIELTLINRDDVTDYHQRKLHERIGSKSITGSDIYLTKFSFTVKEGCRSPVSDNKQ